MVYLIKQEKGGGEMLAIIAFLSDIPMYIAEIISKLTGADMSGFITKFSDIFAKIIEAFETILG